MKMPNACIVAECRSSEAYKKYPLHKTPKDKKVAKIWIERAGCKDMLANKCRKFVCGRHFYNSQYRCLVNKLLIPNTLPCRYLPIEYPEPQQRLSFETNRELIKSSEWVNAVQKIEKLVPDKFENLRTRLTQINKLKKTSYYRKPIEPKHQNINSNNIKDISLNENTICAEKKTSPNAIINFLENMKINITSIDNVGSTDGTQLLSKEKTETGTNDCQETNKDLSSIQNKSLKNELVKRKNSTAVKLIAPKGESISTETNLTDCQLERNDKSYVSGINDFNEDDTSSPKKPKLTKIVQSRKRKKRISVKENKISNTVQLAVLKDVSEETLVKLDLKETKFIAASEVKIELPKLATIIDIPNENKNHQIIEDKPFDIDISVKIVNNTKSNGQTNLSTSQYLDLKNVSSNFSSFGNAVKANEIFLENLVKMSDLSQNSTELDPQFVFVPGEGNVPVYIVNLNVPYIGVVNYAITLAYDQPKGIIPIATNYVPALEKKYDVDTMILHEKYTNLSKSYVERTDKMQNISKMLDPLTPTKSENTFQPVKIISNFPDKELIKNRLFLHKSTEENNKSIKPVNDKTVSDSDTKGIDVDIMTLIEKYRTKNSDVKQTEEITCSEPDLGNLQRVNSRKQHLEDINSRKLQDFIKNTGNQIIKPSSLVQLMRASHYRGNLPASPQRLTENFQLLGKQINAVKSASLGSVDGTKVSHLEKEYNSKIDTIEGALNEVLQESSYQKNIKPTEKITVEELSYDFEIVGEIDQKQLGIDNLANKDDNNFSFVETPPNVFSRSQNFENHMKPTEKITVRELSHIFEIIGEINPKQLELENPVVEGANNFSVVETTRNVSPRSLNFGIAALEEEEQQSDNSIEPGEILFDNYENVFPKLVNRRNEENVQGEVI